MWVLGAVDGDGEKEGVAVWQAQLAGPGGSWTVEVDACESS